MNSLKFSMSVLAAATLATSVLAADRSNNGAAVPAPSTVQAVTAFIDGYADHGVLSTASVSRHAKRLVVYPTANRNVVFVTFEADGANYDHIGLAHTQGGRVTGFTDFTGSHPRQVRTVAAVSRDDAQSQARALLVSAAPLAMPTSRQPFIASRQAPASAQSQAADLLRSTPATRQTVEPRPVLALRTPAVYGDSQAMARALLTWSTGE